MESDLPPGLHEYGDQIGEHLQCILILFEVRRGKRILEMKEGFFRVGRDEIKCAVALDPLDRSASREHFVIDNRSGQYFLTNLSSNGTFINGEKVSSKGRHLYHGDVIEAGNSELTFLLSKRIEGSIQRLIDEGRKSELLEPAHSIQCYALVLREHPANVECAALLLSLLIRQERYEEIITGSNYFEPQKMLQLANDPRIAVPLAKAYIRVGDFSAAMNIVELGGGPTANYQLEKLTREIRQQTGGQLLTTTFDKPEELPFFQRDTLRVYFDDRVDFPDLWYIERYYKYIRQRINPLFGGPVVGVAEFHITIRDQLFTYSLPGQTEILGYYSPSSRRIFIRPRRWIQMKAKDEYFYITLLHEYVHLRVHEACGSVLPPKWYNEGLALLFTEESQITDTNLLRDAQTKYREIMRLTDDCFSPTFGDPTWAYMQSLSMLRYLAERFGKEALISILNTMGAAGKSFIDAFYEILHTSIVDFGEEWWRIIGSKK